MVVMPCSTRRSGHQCTTQGDKFSLDQHRASGQSIICSQHDFQIDGLSKASLTGKLIRVACTARISWQCASLPRIFRVAEARGTEARSSHSHWGLSMRVSPSSRATACAPELDVSGKLALDSDRLCSGNQAVIELRKQGRLHGPKASRNHLCTVLQPSKHQHRLGRHSPAVANCTGVRVRGGRLHAAPPATSPLAGIRPRPLPFP